MYTIRCRALATDDTDPDGAQMLIEEPVEVIVMRRYSDFRKMLGKYSKANAVPQNVVCNYR